MSDCSPATPPPTSSLPDADGNEVSLADHKGRKVIVYFYPAAMTPGCTKQACDFTDNLDVLAGAGYDVIGVSPDKPEKLAKFRDKENLKVTLVGDPSKDDDGGVRRLRREEALRQDRDRRHPLHGHRRTRTAASNARCTT